MPVIAKMHVVERTEHEGLTRPPEHFTEDHWFQKDENGQLKQNCKCENDVYGVANVSVILKPVYSQEEGHENHAFWDATPSGSLELMINNPAAAAYFETGVEYYVEIRKVQPSKAR